VFFIVASEAYSSSGSEESEISSYSDWESLDETEDPGVSSLQSGAAAAAALHSYETKVSFRNFENLNTK
jgi:heme-degrading monooxygenase HmoA